MKYIIDGEYEFTDAREVAEHITENMGDDAYDDMLDDCYGDIDICGLPYSASIALYCVDKIAYNCGRNDYYDSLASDIAYDVDRMDDGDEEEFYGFVVECVDDEEPDDDADEADEEEEAGE